MPVHSPSTNRTKAPAEEHHRNRWLTLIAAFKLLQAILFVALALGAFHFLHKDLDDELEKLARHLLFNPESKFVNFVIEKAALVDDRLLRRIGAVSFIYAGLDVLEGVGLYLEKIWAEYLTLIITASFLPLELYEIFRRVTVMRVSLLALNALVFYYLFKLIAERVERHHKAHKASQARQQVAE